MAVDMEVELRKINALGDMKAKTSAIEKVISTQIANNAGEPLCQLITLLMGDETALVLTRAVLQYLGEHFDDLESDQRMIVGQKAIDLMLPRLVSFEEYDTVLKNKLAETLKLQEDYLGAARIMAGINVENGRFSDTEKSIHYVKVAEFYLEDDDDTMADSFVGRASQVIHNCESDEYRMRHKVCSARVLDARRKFMEAALRYYEISTGLYKVNGEHLLEEELNMLLTKATVCAILANAGPQRSRILGTLYADERTRTLEVHWPVLEKMFMQRILKSEEVKRFEGELLDHQKTSLNGITILQRAVTEHNVLSASRVYTSVSFAELGTILETDAKQAERIATTMIVEGRMSGTVDQLTGLLLFDDHDADNQLGQFDTQIKQFCLDLNSTVSKITEMYPDAFPEM